MTNQRMSKEDGRTVSAPLFLGSLPVHCGRTFPVRRVSGAWTAAPEMPSQTTSYEDSSSSVDFMDKWEHDSSEMDTIDVLIDIDHLLTIWFGEIVAV